MKKFSVTLLKLLVATFLLMCLVEVVIENRYTKGIGDKKTDLHLLVNRNSDIVIVGNSRVRWHINPDSIASHLGKSVTSVVIDGTTIEELAFKFNFYLKYNTPPQYVFFSTDLGATKGKKALKRKENYLRYLFFTNPYAKDVWAFDETLSFKDKYIPTARYSGYFERLLSTLRPMSSNSFVLGFQDGHRDSLKELEYVTDTVDMLNTKKEVKLFTKNLNPTTKVICFTPFKPSKIFHCINEGQFPYPHFNTSLFFSRDSLHYFQDGGHLNYNGALIYTRQVANEMKKYLAAKD